jgi:two-component system chemotaxis response regulator CheB
MISVLVVEDSPTVRAFLVHIFSRDPELRVVGTATNGAEALEAVQRLKPDVITMDMTMPRMNGFEATRQIMETMPTPIVIVSGSQDPKEVATTFQAMEAGALAVLPRPQGPGHPEFEATAAALVQTVKLMAEVKVVRRWPRTAQAKKGGAVRTKADTGVAPAGIQVVAIGASTGGPLALQTVLSGLSPAFPVPVLIVQHMAPGFIQGFVDWLAQTSGFPVHVAVDGEALAAGQAYVAPDGYHMKVSTTRRILLTKENPDHGLRPSVSRLFHAVADVFGAQAAGVLLTGMGTDGAEGLKRLKDLGAATIAQDEGSAVVHGMPGAAIQEGAALYVLPPERIAVTLKTLVGQNQ